MIQISIWIYKMKKMKRRLYFWRCTKCGREVVRLPGTADYIKDHYYLGKFCSNTNWVPVAYQEIDEK